MPNDNFDAQLQTEFRDLIHDHVGQVNAAFERLENKASTASEALSLIRRCCHTMKGAAASYHYGAIAEVSQRFDNYLHGLTTLDAKEVRDLQVFIDEIGRLAELSTQPTGEDIAKVLRNLPFRYEFNVKDVEIRHVEIMVVTPSKVTAKVVSQELMACGFRPLVMHDPIEALTSALRAKPSMVIASAVIDPISGIDVLQALRHITSTSSLPLAILTSNKGDTNFATAIPEKTFVLHTNSFSDDFANVIAATGLG